METTKSDQPAANMQGERSELKALIEAVTSGLDGVTLTTDNDANEDVLGNGTDEPKGSDGTDAITPDNKPKEIPRENLMKKPKATESEKINQERSTLKDYLLTNAPEFARVEAVREEVWSRPEIDRLFNWEKQSADTANDKTAFRFFNMMSNIGGQMNEATGALRINQYRPKVLDMCMAPGGFLQVILEMNPRAQATAFTLPVADGGHKVLLGKQLRARTATKFLDVTMLACDIGVTDMPRDGFESVKLLPKQIRPRELFDLVICDGAPLRTQVQTERLDARKSDRLKASQLAIGLRHLKMGGTMIILYHHIEALDVADLLHSFSKFAEIQIFKPKKIHTKKASFYTIAKDIQTNHPEVTWLLTQWQDQWKFATYGTDTEYQEFLEMECPNAEALIKEFGEKLIELGKDIWTTQTMALAKLLEVEEP